MSIYAINIKKRGTSQLKKYIFTLATVAVVGFTSIFSSTPASAESIDELKSKQSEIEKERESLKSDLSKTEAEIADILIDIENLNEELKQLNMELELNKLAIKENEKQIISTEEEIEKLEIEIAELQEAIDKRFEILKDRAVAYQVNGGNISYIEVLFGAKSFGDFISRISAINRITDSDAQLMEQIEEDKKAVEKIQDEVKTQLENLQLLKKDLEKTKVAIEEQQKEVKAMTAVLKDEEKKLAAKVKELKMEDSKLASLERKVRQSINELKQPVVHVANSSQGNLSTLSKGSSSSSGGGVLAWPTIGGYISSYVGPRWGRVHKGIDIARPSKYDILAAESGTVTKAGYSGGFGNRIEIDHGNGIKTLYAHLSSIGVSVGQSVQRGEKIGVMGTTGNSTGIHLHFEVHENGSYQNPLDYLP